MTCEGVRVSRVRAKRVWPDPAPRLNVGDVFHRETSSMP
jgi:hypothetical protein